MKIHLKNMTSLGIRLTILLAFSTMLFACKTLVKDNNTAVSRASNSTVTYPDSLKQLHANVVSYFSSLPIKEADVAELLASITPEGTWADVNYNDPRRGKWQTKEHLEHVQLLTRTYKNKESKYYNQKEVGDKIQLSLNYWLKNDFLSTNWWDQFIGVPELLAPIVILMEPELSKKQINEAVEIMNRAKIYMDGQNKVWLSANVMLRSLILRKTDSVKIASNALQGELEFSDGVGLQKDFSYHEHGVQLQFGNYGLSYLEDLIKWNQILNNTPFQFKAEKLGLLRDYILKGQQWVVFKESYDILASGRQLVIGGSAKKYSQLKEAIKSIEQVDKSYKNEYEKAISSDHLVGDKHFYRSDFQVHRTKDFYFSVKMSSERTVGTESVNEENIQGYHLGDGTSLLYQNGQEYQEVLPFLDWRKLPGITVSQNPGKLPMIKSQTFKTNSVFVGGVDDTKDGIATMAYDRDGVKAKKGWFMFGNYVVCLGSDINANTSFPITTGINQLLEKGQLEYSENGKPGRKNAEAESTKPSWISHNGLGYLFPKGGNIKMESGIAEGSWAKVSTFYRPVILLEKVFRLWFDHGVNPKDKSYEYILVPNTTRSNMEALNKGFPFTILNTKAQQFVMAKDGSLGGVIFYESGTSDLFGGVSVSQPLVLMVKKTDDGLALSVSDPSQTLTTANVSFAGKFSGENTTFNNQKTNLNIVFPKGKDAGKTVNFLIKKI